MSMQPSVVARGHQQIKQERHKMASISEGVPLGLTVP